MVKGYNRDKKEMEVTEYYSSYIDIIYVLKDLRIIPLSMATKLEQEAWRQSLWLIYGEEVLLEMEHPNA